MIKKIKDFKVVTGETYIGLSYTSALTNLENKVKRLLEEGWQPLGGVAVVSDDKFLIAMVLPDEDEK